MKTINRRGEVTTTDARGAAEVSIAACASGIIAVIIIIISWAPWQRITWQRASVSFNVRNLLHGNVLLNLLMADANQSHRFLSAMHDHMWYGDRFTPSLSPMRRSYARLVQRPPPPVASCIADGETQGGAGIILPEEEGDMAGPLGAAHECSEWAHWGYNGAEPVS